MAMNLKPSIQDLAIFGGKPAFPEKLHVGRPNVGDRKKLQERLDDILERRWFTNEGKYVRELERKICEYLGVKHCIATCNGTIAIQIVSRALDLKGEVILPSFTFIATPHALEWQEISPVFCDIDPHTMNIDPQKVEKLINPRTTGIVGVHIWGRSCDVEALEQIAHKNNLKLLFDAAHAFGCSHKGKMIGHFGEAEVFSFHATKFLNSFEGGAVVTNNDELAAKVRYMENFGFGGHDEGIYIGTNGKMNEVSAAMGLTNLESMDHFVQVNEEHYALYQEELKEVAGIDFVSFDPKEKNNYQYIVLLIDPTKTQINADNMSKVLHKENILVKRYFYPGCHRQEPYFSYFRHAGLLLPETESMNRKTLLVPTGTAVSKDDVKHICALIRLIVSNGREITNRLSKN